MRVEISEVLPGAADRIIGQSELINQLFEGT